jgi:hypothetical protein
MEFHKLIILFTIKSLRKSVCTSILKSRNQSSGGYGPRGKQLSTMAKICKRILIMILMEVNVTIQILMNYLSHKVAIKKMPIDTVKRSIKKQMCSLRLYKLTIKSTAKLLLNLRKPDCLLKGFREQAKDLLTYESIPDNLVKNSILLILN